MTQRRGITPVILSGGSGTRLWPLSRTGRPKQLLALTHAETMLQLTVQRACGDRFAAPIVVANTAHADEIATQMAAVGVPDARLILEPAARNTAPAIALAAVVSEPDDILLVMPSDHVIADVEAFHAAIERAAPLVEAGWLVTFGIQPTAPETGYGYICRGKEIAVGVQRVERFVEKPDRATAEGYLAEGRYSWNGGIFLFTAGAYLEALDEFAPEMSAAARAAIADARRRRSADLSRCRRLRPIPIGLDRLCGDGESRSRRGRAGRYGLVGCRQLGCVARTRRQGR